MRQRGRRGGGVERRPSPSRRRRSRTAERSPDRPRRQQHPLPIEGHGANFAALGDATVIAAGGRRGRGGEA